MIFGPVPFFDIHHILQNRSISCWHFQKLQEKSTVAQTSSNPTWNIFGPQINTPNSSIPNLQCFYPILSKPRSAGEGAAGGTTHKVHQTARRLGLSRDHVTSHLNTSQPLAPWNSLPTKNFGKFQKHLSSIIQPIPVHPFLFPAVFDCCEHPLICPCLWKIHWTTGHLTQLLCLGSLLSLVSANSNSHGPQQQPQSTAVYVYLCLLQRLSHLSPLASAPPCPA